MAPDAKTRGRRHARDPGLSSRELEAIRRTLERGQAAPADCADVRGAIEKCRAAGARLEDEKELLGALGQV